MRKRLVWIGLLLVGGCAAHPADRSADAAVASTGRAVSPAASSAPAAAAAEVAVARGIQIQSARYGNGTASVDVTAECRELITGDTLVLPRDLHKTLDVDPDPGFMKYLDLVLTIDGVPVSMSVADNLQLMPLRLSLTHRPTSRPAP